MGHALAHECVSSSGLTRLFLPDLDSEELEKELASLLRDTTKDPSDRPDSPLDTFQTNSVPSPGLSDAELEAELEKLSLSEGGRPCPRAPSPGPGSSRGLRPASRLTPVRALARRAFAV